MGDARDAMAKFFENYPELKENGFYIAGESYAGVYVPTLAEAILFAKGNGTWDGAELRAIAVGNGCTGTEIGVCGGEQKYIWMYMLNQAFVPQVMKDDIRSKCGMQFEKNSYTCDAAIEKMRRTIGHIDLYNIYGDCISGSEAHTYGQEHARIPLEALAWQKSGVGGPDACIDSVLGSAYFNQPSVIEASHVKKQPFRWSTCGNQINYKSTRPNLPRDTYPFLNEHIHVIIYNGDWDACVPYTDNEAWTSSMGYNVKEEWQAWTYDHEQDGHFVTGQVGGYRIVYDTPHNFTFTTIRGGRHEVPETAPIKAFTFFERFLKGGDLDE